MASAGRRGSVSKDKKAAADERRKSLAEENELETVHSADEQSPLSGVAKLKAAGKGIGAARSMAQNVGAMGAIVRPGIIDCELVMEYFMHGPPKGDDHEHRHHDSDHLKESVERSMYAIFDDRFFLHDAFKGLDEGGAGVLTEEQMRHWVSCIDSCSPVIQATSEPSTRCKACTDGKMSSSQSTQPERWTKTLYGKPPAPNSSTPFKCKCVPCAPSGGGSDWMTEVSWVSPAVAATTLDDQMENIIVDVLQKRPAIAPEDKEKDRPKTFFDWDDFLVITMDFYVALGTRSMHAIFAVLLGNEADEVGPAASPKPSQIAMNGADANGAGEDDGESTRPAARAAFGDADGTPGGQVIGVEKGGGGLFGCFRPKKAATATPAAAAPAAATETVAEM